LREDRFDGGREVVVAVVDWQSDRDFFKSGRAALGVVWCGQAYAFPT
jgi:hypothetical protein